MSSANERRVADEAEKTLHAFDDDRPLQENPFLASRIQAAMSSRMLRRNEWLPMRVNLKYAVMGLILLINLITAVHYFESNSTTTLQERLVSDLEQDFQIDQPQNVF